MHRLILASQSPRRTKILKDAGFVFTTEPIEISEFLSENMNLEVTVRTLAEAKMTAWREHHKSLKREDILVLTADTVVGIGSRLLGKPENLDQAREFLRLLSGKTHEVKTALCFWDWPKDQLISVVATTKVTFRDLADVEIEAYIKTDEAYDKAGGYGIQGSGGKWVSKIEGSHSNVVGLPLELFESTIKKEGWTLDRR